MVAIMIVGIAFSISNFVSFETTAAGGKGIWVEGPDGSYYCGNKGTECALPR